MQTSQYIPVILVHGSLGSGKTTFISHLLTHPELADALIIENEFASEDIDTQTLDSHRHGKTLSIAGGCICCSSAEELEEALAEIIRMQWTKPVIIETTGVASSSQLLQKLFLNQNFLEHFAIRRNIFVVDPLEVTPEKAAGELQLETALADMVVINKADLAGDDRVNNLKKAFTGLNPVANVVVADHGRVSSSELQLDAGSDVEQALAENHDQLLAGSRTHDLRYVVHDMAGACGEAAFVAAIKKLAAMCDVRRCKGYFYDDSGVWWHYEATAHHAELKPTTPKAKSLIIFIGKDVTPAAVAEAGFKGRS